MHWTVDDGTLPIVVLLPFAGGLGKQQKSLMNRMPFYANFLLVNMGGSHRVPLSSKVESALMMIRVMCRERPIILYGGSRGGRWIYELALKNPSLFDAAVAVAGYPPTLDEHSNRVQAREVAHTHP